MNNITKPNDLAFPCEKHLSVAMTGMTKREYFAVLAMQGFCSNGIVFENFNDTVEWSVKIADRLINELNKDPDEKAKV